MSNNKKGAKDVAPDGHDIGCRFSFSWYDSLEEYQYTHAICPKCSGNLDIELLANMQKYKNSQNCHYQFNKPGNW